MAPQQFVAELIKAVDDLVYIRSRARKFTVATAESLGVPSLDANPSDPDWTSELAIGSEDSSLTFGKRELRPYPLAKYIKVSNKLTVELDVSGSMEREFETALSTIFQDGIELCLHIIF